MADPTWAEAWSQFKNRINIFQKTDLFCNTNSPNFLGLQDTLEQSLEGEYIIDVENSVRADRARISALLTDGNLKAAFGPHLLEIARVAGIPDRDSAALMTRLHDYMNTNGYAIKSRGVSFGTPAAVTGSGNGNVYRLTVDRDGYTLDGVFAEAKRAECVFDQGQVDKHEEIFEFRGVEAEQDFLAVLGSGMRVQIPALHSGASSTGKFLSNSSFETFTGTAPTAGSPTTLSTTTELTGWTVTTAANAAVELDTTYRGYPGQPSSLYSVRFTNNNTITQTLNDTVRPTFNPEVPVYVQVAIYRASTVTGNVTLTFGASSVTVALSTLTDNAWNVVKIALGTGLWYKNFRTNGMTVAVQLASYGGSGHIKIDDVIVGEMTNVDGTFYVAVGGSTPFKQDDYSTWTDSISSDSVVQKWLWRSGLGVLPSRANATQVTAAASPTLTFANVGAADTITRSTGSFITDGYYAGMLVTIAGTSNNNMTTGPIATVSATVLTFGSDTSLTNEGPLNSVATLNATPSILDPT